MENLLFRRHKFLIFSSFMVLTLFTSLGAAYAAGERAALGVAPMVPPPITRTEPAKILVELETTEVAGQLKHPLTKQAMDYQFWTFNGTVPGPFIRVRVGDTVELHVKNSKSSKNLHSIDLHAVWGQGGGAKASQTVPGGETGFIFKTMNPGLFVYHCATSDIPMHIANGMYGLILVEPEGGLPKVDREYYIMQGEFYPAGKREDATLTGIQPYSKAKALDEHPEFVLFNAMSDGGKLEAKTGETVRIFVGNGGPNLTSGFHIIGAIFDKVYPEGDLSAPHSNIQTTVIPPGGATIVEMQIRTAANYIMVDHAINRAMTKGAVSILAVPGEDNPEVFKSVKPGAPGGH